MSLLNFYIEPGTPVWWCLEMGVFGRWFGHGGGALVNGEVCLSLWDGACACVHLCPTLCDPMHCGPSDFSVHKIFQARTLEWVAISSSRGFSWPRNWTCISCIGRRILYHCAALKEISALVKETQEIPLPFLSLRMQEKDHLWGKKGALSHQTSNVLVSWALTSSLQNCEKKFLFIKKRRKKKTWGSIWDRRERENNHGNNLPK